VPRYRSRFSKHQFTQPQMLAILCLMRYQDWTYGEAEARLVEHRELRSVPDDTTLYRFPRLGRGSDHPRAQRSGASHPTARNRRDLVTLAVCLASAEHQIILTGPGADHAMALPPAWRKPRIALPSMLTTSPALNLATPAPNPENSSPTPEGPAPKIPE
jgi:hypothetical protein